MYGKYYRLYLFHGKASKDLLGFILYHIFYYKLTYCYIIYKIIDAETGLLFQICYKMLLCSHNPDLNDTCCQA